MTPERAKEIVEKIRAEHKGASANTALPIGRDYLLLHLYDELERIKTSMAGLSFLNAGIQPLKRIDG